VILCCKAVARVQRDPTERSHIFRGELKYHIITAKTANPNSTESHQKPFKNSVRSVSFVALCVKNSTVA
jgi:hypothetical protein